MGVPAAWDEVVEEHRGGVRASILDAAGALAHEHGVTGVTMSGVAERAGIGRATLYRYFPDLESVLRAWHERHVGGQLEQLERAAAAGHGAEGGLRSALTAYAMLRHHQTGSDLGAALHRGAAADAAREHLVSFLSDLIERGVADGALRSDVPAAELSAFVLSGLDAAAGARSKAAVHRVVALVLDAVAAR
jgi:AcrR family transcriptional regulator